VEHTEKTIQEKVSGLYFEEGAEIKHPLPVKGWQPIDPKALDTVFEHTYRAVSKDVSRYFMNGVNLENTPGGLRGIATDGRHLALVDVCCKLRSFKAEVRDDQAKTEKRFIDHIVPIQCIPPVRKLLRQAQEWEILIKNTYMALRSTNGAHTAKVSFINGRFPNYRRVIPEDTLIGGEKLKTMQVAAEQVKNALRELKKSPLYHHAKDEPWQVWFKADSLTRLTLEMRGTMWEQSKYTLTTIAKDMEILTQEDPITELMNGYHLEQACASIKGTMQCEWQAEGKAWQIKPAVLDKELSRLLFVVMPLCKG
jgi:hypothetical protein